ncbi:hypothetical protein WICMUC_004438 [Wickerhamomyces mucosus]|uniref:Methyltransferase type 11 domain-containing protein n=1 Tax=Wickerhamomyces mucosus TaxID=1378264 RepID=A0A9P8TA74_9ASCO|nr:hypothetical protein WICMUC_004438 [Wickerhamomyces mucosus]
MFGTIQPRNFLYKVRSYGSYDVFDRKLKLVQRNRAIQSPKSDNVQYLRNEIAKKTIERLSFIKRPLSQLLDLGSSSGNFEEQLVSSDEEDFKLVRSRLEKITMTDSSEEILNKWIDRPFNKQLNIERIHVDEENLDKKVQSASYDAVISNLILHWTNELPGVFENISSVLKPDGLFLGSMLCEDTVFELRTSIQLAELERRGGITPRFSPLVKVNDVSTLLKKAKFNLVTIDIEEIVVIYPDIFTIIEDLRLMGEQRANLVGSSPFTPDLLLASQEIYKALHGEKMNNETVLPLTFRVLFMVGWKESDSQPKPIERGSGEINLSEFLH